MQITITPQTCGEGKPRVAAGARLCDSAITSTPHLSQHLPFDPLRDFVSVAQINHFSYVLIAHPLVPAKNVGELIALAKAKPGVLTYGSSGVGSALSLDCFAQGIQRRYPNIERVEVPYEGKMLPAWFMKAPNAKGRAPTVVFFNGLDGTKEVGVLYGGVELAARGINLLAIDGPGQGEALRLTNIPSRHDYEVAGTAAYETAAARPDVDPRRVAIMGISMGGYYAPRVAAFEQRYAACVAWGGHYDYHASWVRRRKEIESGGTKVSAPYFHLMWVLGVPDMDAAMAKLRQYTLAGVAAKITCPFLVTHGENDTIVPADYARLLYDAVGASNKTIKIFTADEGGSEHVQGDNRVLGSNYVADWLADNL